MSIEMTNYNSKQDNGYKEVVVCDVSTFVDNEWKNVKGDAAYFILKTFKETDEYEKASKIILEAVNSK